MSSSELKSKLEIVAHEIAEKRKINANVNKD